jgi:hypothetical protein
MMEELFLNALALTVSGILVALFTKWLNRH